MWTALFAPDERFANRSRAAGSQMWAAFFSDGRKVRGLFAPIQILSVSVNTKGFPIRIWGRIRGKFVVTRELASLNLQTKAYSKALPKTSPTDK
ncbi:hypothetical protein AVEN_136922-1 [Araneus ventricosus]|uniref:Uncharacterized protein n=1 Tax=Araneus ventricosus TaxID=182803 RepID=A0A4Y2BGP0_ARAVE|nr:hypothetical protein AVEN_136922-1 [Araneus ventricosus]